MQRERPSIVCLQEDSMDMLHHLFTQDTMFRSSYQVFPPPEGCTRQLAPGAAPLGPLQQGARWEQCSVWWNASILDLVKGGQYEWADHRSESGAPVCHMIPLTWVLLRWKRKLANAPLILVCNTHLEAGHSWLSDV
ncbi:hypothetical protein CYMTET_34238 [Cymbomonas tetramitiformis]|uniref:Uncharacterized protein n=1 Tax=Cymbomonas tetramitiformis TaxID=36881 RepID=A0AAE0FBH7_9CHLO|nr:hypothetical protein CYMTET_34238 [Cymbomonas tetramitiformis]